MKTYSTVLPKMSTSALAALVALLLAVPAVSWAKPKSAKKLVNEEQFFVHTAVKGDTLSGIAHRYLEKKRDWRMLNQYNLVADPDEIPIGKQIRIPQSAMRAENSGAEVIAVKGAPNSNGKLIAAGSKLAEGDRIETPQDGFVSIRLADGSILKVQSQSSVKLERARILANTGGVSDAVVNMQSGRLETDVNKQKQGARYEVRTPSSNMGVRGTIFRASSSTDGSKSASEVVEGLVAVAGQGLVRKEDPVQLAAGFGTLIEAGKPPSMPVALLPAPAYATASLRTETDAANVTVRPVAGATAYRAQLARDAAFSNVLANASGASTQLNFGAVPTGSYHVRVRAIDSSGLEGMDAATTLRVMPNSPRFVATVGVPIEPIDGSRMTQTSPRFSWDPIGGVVGYRLQVSREREFTQLVIDVPAPVATHSPTGALTIGQYFWRVASVDGAELARFSPINTFSIIEGDPLTLKLPKVDGAEVVLTWTGEGRDDAELVIASDDRFQKIVRTERVTGGTLRLSDLGRGHYFVKVRTRIGDTSSAAARENDWSVVEPFSVYSGSKK